jgi:flagellar FliJ protein
MPSSLPLDMLIELSQSKTDEATRLLGLLQNAHTSQAQKLSMLQDYQQEYLDQFQTQMRAGLSSSQVRNYQHFIGTLAHAIDQQRLITEQAKDQLANGRTHWQQSKRRVASFDALAERARLEAKAVQGKKEQRDSDERASRQFSMRQAEA